MKNFYYMISIVVLFIINGICVCTEVEKKEEGTIFVHKFNPGEEIKCELTIENKGKTSVGKTQATTSQRIELIFRQKVENVNEEGTGFVIQFYEKARVDGKEFALQGKKVTLRIAKNGELLESSGLSEILDVMVKGGFTGAPGADRIPVSFKGIDSNLLNTIFEKIWPIFPDKRLKVGDSWEVPVDIMGEQILNLRYLLVKMEKLNNYDCAKIEMSYAEGGNALSAEMFFAPLEGRMIEGNAFVELKTATTIDTSKYIKTGKSSYKPHPIRVVFKREMRFTLKTLEKK